MEKPKFQIIKFEVNSPGQVIKIDETTKLDHHMVKGVLFSVSDQNASKGGEIQLSVDGEEILPDLFDITLLTKYEGISMKEATHSFVEKAQNSTIKGEYKDGKVNGTNYPYSVKIILITSQQCHE